MITRILGDLVILESLCGFGYIRMSSFREGCPPCERIDTLMRIMRRTPWELLGLLAQWAEPQIELCVDLKFVGLLPEMLHTSGVP
jgi:hypothetical protein